MIDMASDSDLFVDHPGFGLLPLYEAKMMHQFDHRWATYSGATQANLNAGILPQMPGQAKRDISLCATSKYWVPQQEVDDRSEFWEYKWLIGFRDITAAMVERTSIFSVLPYAGVGHSISLMLPDPTKIGGGLPKVCCLLANLNSLIADFIVRNKLTYIHLSYFVLKQIPLFSPDRYTHNDLVFIVPRVLELVYTATDVSSFAENVFQDASEDVRLAIRAQHMESSDEKGHESALPPFSWDDRRRVQIRAELDAYFAHLYGLTREELRYILDPKDVYGEDFPSETFRVLKVREMKEFGEYRTQRLVLEAFDKLAESPCFRDEMPKRVSALEAPKHKN
jgi:hypothetical protein